MNTKVIKGSSVFTTQFSGTIYVSHAFGGKQENIDEITSIIREARKHFPNALFVSPVHCFGFLYDDTEYIEGMNMTLWLLHHCDVMISFGEISRGVQIEIDFCQKHKKPYLHVNTLDELLEIAHCNEGKSDKGEYIK